jgi:soluble lytic murein transglycosylase-like protein
MLVVGGYMTIAFLLAAALAGVDPALLSAVCYVESNHNAAAYSPHDGHSASYGTCQVKEATARGLGFKGSKADLQKYETNIYYAALYLSKQLKRYGTIKKAVSSYNAGKPIKSNKSYVDKVLKRFQLTRGEYSWTNLSKGY